MRLKVISIFIIRKERISDFIGTTILFPYLYYHQIIFATTQRESSIQNQSILQLTLYVLLFTSYFLTPYSPTIFQSSRLLERMEAIISRVDLILFLSSPK